MRKTPDPKPVTPFPPATTQEEREQQLISRAYDLVERRLMDGTATSQETVYFLKLASTQAKLEQRRQEQEIKLSEAKIEAMESEKKQEEFYKEVIAAIRSYQGGYTYDEDVQ